MEKAISVSIALSAITLAIVLGIFFIVNGMHTELAEIAEGDFIGEEGTILIQGRGNVITRTVGGGACDPNTVLTVETSIAGGSAGNQITGRAECILSSTSVTTTTTDPGAGNGGNFTRSQGNVGGTGQGYCGKTYTPVGTSESAWNVLCTFG